MAYFKDQMFGAEPFEESQGNEANKLASADDLKAYYRDMEKKEKQQQLERKASRRKSMFSRNRSLKTSAPRAAANSGPESIPPSESLLTATTSSNLDSQDEMEEKDDVVSSSLPTARSIIPDTLKQLPAWYTKDDWSSTTSHRARFPIHNPVGPRYYRNLHLIPPSVYRPGARPPSVFSPSFPAMGTSSMPERLDDNVKLPSPSRTPSHSPLPTPSSSQTRVADLGIKPRSRKTSQTAHDNVDLLDVSDPWGTNWHHESPYDIGLGSSGPIAPDTDPSRSRRSSMTAQARRKTLTPSPLSQSTSALHLQASQVGGPHMHRKLSKRRGLSGIFGSYGKSHQLNAKSLPTSPVGDVRPHSPLPHDDNPKRASTMPPGPPPSNKPISAIKKEQRGSILGRLTKRFSVSRKPSSTVSPDGLPHTEEHTAEIQSVFNKSSEKISKRVPPPSVDDLQVDELPLKASHDADQRSSISVDASFPVVGRLTVANPDAPSSEISTPPQNEIPLPADSSDPQPGRNVVSNAQSPLAISSFSPPLSMAQIPEPNTRRKYAEPSTFVSPPLNGHVHASDYVMRSLSPLVNGGSSQRQSLEDKPLPKSSEMGASPTSSNTRRSLEQRRPRSPERGPPPPSSTTKPIPLPNVSVPPPPPSATTKPIPLPSTAAPVPPSATTKPIPLPSTAAPAPPSATTKYIPLPSTAAPAPPSATTKYIPLPGTAAPVPPSATTKPVPLPETAVAPFPQNGSSLLSVNQAIAEDSPLSAASMLANPPTPQVVDETLIHAPTIMHSSSREPSPGISSVTVRETETFKLIRTTSGNVRTVNETIPAAGEQWEVVEETSTKRSSKSRDKDHSGSSRDHADSRERDMRRESRRQEKRAAEVESESNDHRGKQRSHSHRQHSIDGLPHTETPYSNKVVGRSSSLESHHRSPIPDYMRQQQDEVRSGRTRDSGRRSSRKTSGSHSVSPTKPSTSSRPLERTPSKSARPTSEVPSAADLNALRAREAWEMERLHKGRSMYGGEQNGETVASPLSVPALSASLPNGPTGPTSSKHSGATHGSSHTSFVVQNFGNQGSGTTQIYHSMPTQPPPSIHTSTSLPVGQVASVPSPPRAQSLLSPTSSDPLNLSRTPNPLPSPPRETPTPPRISQTFSDAAAKKEYWTTFAEVTTH